MTYKEKKAYQVHFQMGLAHAHPKACSMKRRWRLVVKIHTHMNMKFIYIYIYTHTHEEKTYQVHFQMGLAHVRPKACSMKMWRLDVGEI
jgi:hypothetical protein